MNVRTNLLMDETTFFEWLERQERKHELVDGRPVIQPGVSGGHAALALQIVELVKEQLDTTHWMALVSDFAVRVGPRKIRYPDVLLLPRRAFDRKAYATAAPALVVEILSESSIELDLGAKANEYLGLPSVEAYLVFSQEQPRVYCWIRQDDRFPAGPVPLEGIEQTVRVPSLGLSLPLQRVYAGIVEEPTPQ